MTKICYCCQCDINGKADLHLLHSHTDDDDLYKFKSCSSGEPLRPHDGLFNETSLIEIVDSDGTFEVTRCDKCPADSGYEAMEEDSAESLADSDASYFSSHQARETTPNAPSAVAVKDRALGSAKGRSPSSCTTYNASVANADQRSAGRECATLLSTSWDTDLVGIGAWSDPSTPIAEGDSLQLPDFVGTELELDDPKAQASRLAVPQSFRKPLSKVSCLADRQTDSFSTDLQPYEMQYDPPGPDAPSFGFEFAEDDVWTPFFKQSLLEPLDKKDEQGGGSSSSMCRQK